MPFDLGDHTAHPVPRPGLVTETGVEPDDVIWWTTDGTLEQMGDVLLQNRIRLEADGLEVAFSFQERIKIRDGEGGVGAEIASQFNEPRWLLPHCRHCIASKDRHSSHGLALQRAFRVPRLEASVPDVKAAQEVRQTVTIHVFRLVSTKC